jgi:glycosyltransferase involved in cell wall biosynthesis
MRILWHGPHGFPTGYALQTDLFAPMLAGLGHEVVISQMDRPAKHQAGRDYQGIKVIGPAAVEYALPLLEMRMAFGGHDPDLIIVLKDAWVLNPQVFRRFRTAVWCNFDAQPMPHNDRAFFAASGAIPIAVSKWGLSQMRAAGLDGAVYIPHGIEAAQWYPAADRYAVREELGLPAGAYCVGLNGMNTGRPSRKAFGEQFDAFAAFHVKHPNALLLCHTKPDHPEGMDLHALARALRIQDLVLFPSHTTMDQAAMLSWYQALDVLLMCTWGEGFGLPVLEALGCGVPVIGTDCSALPEKIPAQAGWLVKGQRWWHPDHRAWWTIPNTGHIAQALEKAHRRRPGTVEAARDVAASYDAERVLTEYWKPFLDTLEA